MDAPPLRTQPGAITSLAVRTASAALRHQTDRRDDRPIPKMDPTS